MKLTTIPIILTITLSACISSNDDTDSEDFGFQDGTYCAQVEYYNPNTGTRSEYKLNVDVESNELVLIHWTNGGWLDEDHFDPVELDNEGYCEFMSDEGYEYTVSINGPECSFTEESLLQEELEQDEEAITCRRCGNEKDKYDSYCSSCEDEVENTCSECGRYEYGVNQGLCETCENVNE